jgi:hypothetical protein
MLDFDTCTKDRFGILSLSKEQFLANRGIVEEFKNEAGYLKKYKTDEESWENYRANCFGTVLLLNDMNN